MHGAATMEGAISTSRRKQMMRQTDNETPARRLKKAPHMTTGHHVVLYAVLAAAIAITGGSSFAQHITGTPGAPSATMTINGEQLPAPPPKFDGVIKDTAPQSTPYWPPRLVPPTDAPNVLLIMTDDAGFGVPSTFGGVIPTPAL